MRREIYLFRTSSKSSSQLNTIVEVIAFAFDDRVGTCFEVEELAISDASKV